MLIFKLPKAIRIVLQIMGFTCLCHSLNAQTAKITGNVVDEKGEAIIGATVIEKGTHNGATTDSYGNFTINISPDAILDFSCIGYVKQEIKLNGQTKLKIVLQEDAELLDDVVVIGYGTARKKDLTGSISSVDGKQIANKKVLRTSQALQGTIPGLWVTRSAGSDPSASASLRVRGVTTINNSDPLVIIDGIPGTLDWVNPDDIESISFMKDAASASIYGARAASGVILVTTKRAKAGILNINYSYEYSIDKPTQIAKAVGAKDYMGVVNERNWNDRKNVGSMNITYSEDMINNYDKLHAENPDLYPDVDWMDIMTNDQTSHSSHKLDIISGGEKSKTKISASYDESGSLIPHKKYDRMMIRSNYDLTIAKWLDISVDFHGIYSINRNPSRWTPNATSRICAPIYAAVWSDGRIAEGKTGFNPYGLMERGGTLKDKALAIGGKIAINLKPFNGFVLTGVFSPEIYKDKRKEFYKAVSYTNWDDPNTIIGNLQDASKSTLWEYRPDWIAKTSQLFANYTKSIGNHNINAMAGYENYTYAHESMSGSRDNYQLLEYPYLNIGDANYQYANGSSYENAYRSFYGRIMYNWNNKYFLQANGRYDGSSRFASDYRWGFFPSFSIGWMLSEESFIKDKINWLNSLKVRASWGQLGNERIGNYPYQSTIGFTNDILLYKGNEVVAAQAAGVYKYAIHDISWETTSSMDFGIDATLFKGRLRFSGDIYKKETKDMLLALQIPIYVGLENPDQNTGKMHTNGWEIELGWNDHISDINYSASFNISDSKSKLGDLGGTEFLGNQVKMKGSEFNEWYGYVSEGLFQTQEEVDNSPKLNSRVSPGDIKYKDISGPDGIPDGVISPEYDRKLLGGSLPRYTFGGSFNIDWHNLDFGVTFNGIGKHKVSKMVISKPLKDQFLDIPEFIMGKYWSVLNSEGQNLKAKYPRLSQTSDANNYIMSDYWLFNGAYFRIKNVSLGYTIPKQLSQKLKMQSLRFYINISDPLCINKFPKGYDPEAIGHYWVLTSYLFGVSITF
ncbi:MAG: TonB-dependent receptor [Bacteroidales bacterium]|nr:TonB-dependent receptor [Bacteroidales bacterium]